MEAVLGFLPYLLLFLLCPLMMLFMHRGGAHNGHGEQTPLPHTAEHRDATEKVIT